MIDQYSLCRSLHRQSCAALHYVTRSQKKLGLIRTEMTGFVQASLGQGSDHETLIHQLVHMERETGIEPATNSLEG